MSIEEEKLIQLFFEYQKNDFMAEPLKTFMINLLQHGWARIELSKECFDLIKEWEQVFSNVFELNPQELKESGFYRSVDGVSVGYRGEKEQMLLDEPESSVSKEQSSINQIPLQIKGDREFVECRLQSDGLPNPSYGIIHNYTEIVRNLYKVISRIGFILLQLIAVSLGLDPKTFTDLTDLALDRLESIVERGDRVDLSSSLLRICKYTGGIENMENILDSSQQSSLPSKFGSHTDTSFLTIGVTSSIPALDIFDLIEKRWIAVEENQPKFIVNVFIGEFLQVFTNHYVQASVHRVNDFPIGLTRISCPMIIRANNRKIIDFLNPNRYKHPHYSMLNENIQTHDEDEDDQQPLSSIPSFLILESEKPLDLFPTMYLGLKMKLIHSLLDKRRQKCFEQNSGTEEEESKWTLSSFPITYMT